MTKIVDSLLYFKSWWGFVEENFNIFVSKENLLATDSSSQLIVIQH